MQIDVEQSNHFDHAASVVSCSVYFPAVLHAVFYNLKIVGDIHKKTK